MKKRSLFMLMAAITLASCSKSEIEMPKGAEAGEITLRSSVIDVNTTRAAYEGDDLSANPLTALVLATTNADYSNLRCYGTMTFDGTTTGTPYDKPVMGGVTNGYKFPAANVNVYLTGLYPVNWTGITGTTTNGSLSFALTGKDDVMFAPQVITELNEVNGGTYKTLAFTHQLTLMKLILYCDLEADTKIKIKNIELTKANDADLQTEVTAKLTDPQSITFATPSSTANLPCYATGTDNPYTFASGSEYLVTQTKTEQAYVIAPPVTASNVDGTKEYTFVVNYLDGSDEKTQVVEVDLKQGTDGLVAFDGTTVSHAFNITFKFVGGQIVANATVTDWTQGGSFEQEI